MVKVKMEDKTIEWVLCEEQLPDESGNYLVTDKYKTVQQCWWWSKRDEDVPRWSFECVDSAPVGDRVIAWMPMPEPYKKFAKILDNKKDVWYNDTERAGRGVVAAYMLWEHGERFDFDDPHQYLTSHHDGVSGGAWLMPTSGDVAAYRADARPYKAT
jgi:hypothetical protein